MKKLSLALALLTAVVISVPAEACVFTALVKVSVKAVKTTVHVGSSAVKGTLDGLNYGIGTTLYSTAKRIAK